MADHLRGRTDIFRPTLVPELGILHMDPEGPVPAFGDGMLVDPLPAAGIDAFVAGEKRTMADNYSIVVNVTGNPAADPTAISSPTAPTQE